jgi:hypothetical protein
MDVSLLRKYKIIINEQPYDSSDGNVDLFVIDTGHLRTASLEWLLVPLELRWNLAGETVKTANEHIGVSLLRIGGDNGVVTGTATAFEVNQYMDGLLGSDLVDDFNIDVLCGTVTVPGGGGSTDLLDSWGWNLQGPFKHTYHPDTRMGIPIFDDGSAEASITNQVVVRLNQGPATTDSKISAVFDLALVGPFA